MLPLNRILVPVDFSKCSIKAAHYAIQLAGFFDCPVELLFVWEKPFYVGKEIRLYNEAGQARPMEEFAHDHARRELKKLIEREFSASTVEISYQVVTGKPPTKIVEVAADAGLVVIGTHGRTGLLHILLGSVAEKVIRLAHCPVLTVGLTPLLDQE